MILTKIMQRFRSTGEKTGKLTLGFFLTITGWGSFFIIYLRISETSKTFVPLWIGLKSLGSGRA